MNEDNPVVPAEKPAEAPRKALPHEHIEIAKGSGAAAILLFLHIAVIGYLACIVGFLLISGRPAFWNLVPFSAAIVFYFPAVFPLATYLPTDSLTKVVGRVAFAAGFVALLTYGAALIWQILASQDNKPGLDTGVSIIFGVALAMLLRVFFALMLVERRENFKKSTAVMKHPE